jgi:hypothetical protein
MWSLHLEQTREGSVALRNRAVSVDDNAPTVKLLGTTSITCGITPPYPARVECVLGAQREVSIQHSDAGL